MQKTVLSTQQFYNLLVKSNKIVASIIDEDGIMGDVQTKPAMKKLFEIFNFDKVCITGVRKDDIFTDLATDYFVIPDYENKIAYAIPGSTKPGSAGVYSPKWIQGVLGVAVMVEGFYKKMWKWVTSSNHSTLWSGAPYGHQVGCAVRYLRDGDKNNIITRGTIYSGFIGLNFHSYRNWRNGWMWQLVNKIFNVSEGCQVIPYDYYIEVLPLIDKAATKEEGFISYNLLKFQDIK